MQLLNSEGNWIYNFNDISAEIINYLTNIHANPTSTTEPEQAFLNLLPKLTSEECDSLTISPTTAKIKAALWDIHPYKTPSDNGLQDIFYQKHGVETKNKIIDEINYIFSVWQIQQNWCRTLLCLVPKIDNPSAANHFRPFGLCTTHYKILAKLLVNRSRLFLQKNICPSQGALIKGKHTYDHFLIAQETLHSMNISKSKVGWIILNLT